MLTKWLVKTFVKRPEDTDDERVRYTYGRLAGAAGLTANVLLFAAKLAIGALSGSVAILADAFNNLSDAGSSIVTLVGFKLSSAPPDAEHPFGHGRMEYLSALGVAALIMAAGFELFLSAVDKIRHPALPEFGVLTIVVLALAIAVKLWMALFYKKIGNTIRSEALKASCADSRNDVICTGVVLLTSLIGWLSGVAIDGYVGLLVALFVIWSGFTVIKETVSPLLGQAPDPEMVQDIKNTVMAHPGIIGVHDLMIHNYGPGRLVLSLHAEVSCHEDMMRSHDLIDSRARELCPNSRAIGCMKASWADSGNEEVEALKITVETILEDIDPRLTMHDFRVVFGETHTNLIFDVVAPFDFKDEASVKAELQRRVTVVNPQLFTVVTVEHSFT